MRNRVIHGYASVDHDVIRGVVIAGLPQLINKLQRLVQS
jgi:uncharacterized protein with HEPN domain